jgi:uncharacterized protein (TIGR03086 family)
MGHISWMTTSTDPVEQLADVVDQLAALVDGVRAEQWSAPTPCAEWDVRALVEHLVTGQLLFASALGFTAGADAVTGADDDVRLPDAFRATGAVMLEAFRKPGALDQLVDVPVGRVPAGVAVDLRVTECLVHGWDLARATGQTTTFDDAVVEREIAFTRGALALVPSDRTPFGPEQPVAPDASPTDQLAALLGRIV